MKSPTRETETEWTVEESEKLYGLDSWGAEYFFVNAEGNLCIRVDRQHPERSIELPKLVEDLRLRGIPTPLLLRFNGILDHRIAQLYSCFRQSIEEYAYQGRYRGVYPIKVNQQRHVVESLLRSGRSYGLGLEVGSKPELMAGLAILDDPSALLICNGYKDRAFLEMALWGTRLGRTPIIVIERFGELRDLIEISQRRRIRPVIGLRAKLAARGAGRWEGSSGDRSKFGLGASELLHALDLLRQESMLDCLQLLHFHVGSQINAIKTVKTALREGARLFVELTRLGAPLRYFDIGGGLGVDYDGLPGSSDISLDYSEQEYANDAVWTIQEACDEAGIPHPDIVSESGRALVAHHSVLVVDATGTSRVVSAPFSRNAPGSDAHSCLRNLWEAYETLSEENFTEVFHDVQTLKDEVQLLFSHGILSLRERAQGEEIVRRTYSRLARIVRQIEDVPEEFENLRADLADTYYCNFSLFQSLPDTWAINHMFPVMPIQDLTRRPDHAAILADLTCDSDGKVDHFRDPGCASGPLALHALPRDRRYSIAFFLVGAYQEILGDLHNLFGDTNAVHVELDDSGGYELRHLVEADRISEVLSYVEYDRPGLMEAARRATEESVKAGRMSFEEAGQFLRTYSETLENSTYPTE